MGQDPAVIREQIEHTREHMGETVDALGYKADVPARAKDAIGSRVETLRGKVSGTGSDMAERMPDGEEVRQGAQGRAGWCRRTRSASRSAASRWASSRG